jgi:type II secretory ATPase GspE/PulE/Tfp pilus assembly ATPase PilB-like protein
VIFEIDVLIFTFNSFFSKIHLHRMTEDGNRENCTDWWWKYGIFPTDEWDGESQPTEFFLEAGRDGWAVCQEIFALEGVRIALREVPYEEFQIRRNLQTVSRDSKKGRENGQQSADSLENLLEQAAELGASDLHFESGNSRMLVRIRIHGVLEPFGQVSRTEGESLAIRLKIWAKLQATERFRPQDGRFSHDVGGNAVDFRISVLPTRWGESIVLRILDRRNLFGSLDDLPMGAEVRMAVKKIVSSRSGLFLVTGPTGSGKTTTLHAALKSINHPDIKILTVEDPVEYGVDGIMQVAVDISRGRTFSRVLRSFLRHDPDTIFVGEIRDEETAQVSLRAALTGHFVLSTLHTATAEETLLRLEELGLDRSLIEACLRGILNQRLLRLNCPHCSGPEEMGELPPSLTSSIGTHSSQWGTGCSHCQGKGYGRRVAIFELLATERLGEKGLHRVGPSLEEESLDWVRKGKISAAEFLRRVPWNR